MDRADLIALCLTKPGAYLDAPWGEQDTVVKIGREVAEQGDLATEVQASDVHLSRWADMSR